MPVPVKLILASGSPRRVRLLRQIGLEPHSIEAADIDETPRRGELPRDHAMRIAIDKAAAVSARHLPDGGRALVLAADTVVACGRRILPKAETEDQALRCLDLLEGRGHDVFTAVVVADCGGKLHKRLVATRVKFKRLSDPEKRFYLSHGEWKGRAGGYAVQGRAAVFVRKINGSYSNVVGLPLYETAQLLGGLGYPLLSGENRNAGCGSDAATAT